MKELQQLCKHDLAWIQYILEGRSEALFDIKQPLKLQHSMEMKITTVLFLGDR